MVYWATRPDTKVVCFTGTQIPGIENRHFPKEMCRNDVNGNLYPDGVAIYPESQLEDLIRKFDVDICVSRVGRSVERFEGLAASHY